MPSHYGSKRKKVIKAGGKAVKALSGDAAKRERARRLRAKRKASKEPIDAKAAQRREKELEQIKRNLIKLKKEHEGKKAGAKLNKLSKLKTNGKGKKAGAELNKLSKLKANDKGKKAGAKLNKLSKLKANDKGKKAGEKLNKLSKLKATPKKTPKKKSDYMQWAQRRADAEAKERRMKQIMKQFPARTPELRKAEEASLAALKKEWMKKK